MKTTMTTTITTKGKKVKKKKSVSKMIQLNPRRGKLDMEMHLMRVAPRHSVRVRLKRGERQACLPER
eukprot:502336-Karenia_brevis.AAC.1